MPRRYSTQELVNFAMSLWFQFVSQKWSHMKFKNKEGRVVIIPQKNREIPIWTTMSILEQLWTTIKRLFDYSSK